MKIDYTKPVGKDNYDNRLVFDLDGVIAINPAKNKDYLKHSKPDKEIVKLMRKAHKAGLCIIIYTARRMEVYGGNIGKINANATGQTIAWLKKHKVPYDELIMGKPYGHRYYDDNALNFNRDDMINDLNNIINVGCVKDFFGVNYIFDDYSIKYYNHDEWINEINNKKVPVYGRCKNKQQKRRLNYEKLNALVRDIIVKEYNGQIDLGSDIKKLINTIVIAYNKKQI